MPLLSSACVEVPLVTTLTVSVGHGLPGHFRDHAQCRSCGLSSASVTSVGVVPKWHRSLSLCCANPTARAISDMAVELNPDSNPGLSDLRRLANDIELGPVRVAGSNPGCANREVENFSDELEPGWSELGCGSTAAVSEVAATCGAAALSFPVHLAAVGSGRGVSVGGVGLAVGSAISSSAAQRAAREEM